LEEVSRFPIRLARLPVGHLHESFRIFELLLGERQHRFQVAAQSRAWDLPHLNKAPVAVEDPPVQIGAEDRILGGVERSLMRRAAGLLRVRR
jgi:hypothetical protein